MADLPATRAMNWKEGVQNRLHYLLSGTMYYSSVHNAEFFKENTQRKRLSNLVNLFLRKKVILRILGLRETKQQTFLSIFSGFLVRLRYSHTLSKDILVVSGYAIWFLGFADGRWNPRYTCTRTDEQIRTSGVHP